MASVKGYLRRTFECFYIKTFCYIGRYFCIRKQIDTLKHKVPIINIVSKDLSQWKPTVTMCKKIFRHLCT